MRGDLVITIFTTPSCSSCRKAKKWLDEYRIQYIEKNIFHQRLTAEDLDLMLEKTENGFIDIISTRSKVIREKEIDLENLTVGQAKAFILENPSILKRPIILNEDRIQVGYNEEEIRAFIPLDLREKIIYSPSCKTEEEYTEMLQSFFDEDNDTNSKKKIR